MLSIFLLLALVAAPHVSSFQITNNKTFVHVRVNGSAPQWFILDTGNNGPSLIDSECADRLGLKRGTEDQVQIGAGSGSPTGISQATQAMHLEALGETLTVAEPTVMTLRQVSHVEGRRVDGLLGADFLRAHVIEIDYARLTMTLRDPKAYEPPREAVIVPVDLETQWPVVEGTVFTRGGAAVTARLIVDTGMRGTMTLFRPFSNRHKLRDTAELHDVVMGAGAGGLTRGDLARADSIRIGSRCFAAPVVAFARDTTGIFAVDGPDGIIGGDMLRQNRVTFDCAHGRLILEPYAGAAAPFEADMSGMFLVTDPPGFQTIRIAWVNPGSPAAEQDLRIGDELVAVDGRSTPGLSLDAARELFRRAGVRRLGIRRDGRVMQLRLTTRRLV